MAGMGAALRGPSQDSVLEMVWARWCGQDGVGKMAQGGETVQEVAQEMAILRELSRDCSLKMAWLRR